ncbi:hypothetical protein TNCV_313631 [Trichonephila clavipes]|nr:hypothetical protein TNCV_313631 [Trichonephila clavipes]
MSLSKKLSLAEQKYSTSEKECAAIIFAVQKLKCYLDGHQKFVIQTDHNPLVCASEKKSVLLKEAQNDLDSLRTECTERKRSSEAVLRLNSSLKPCYEGVQGWSN